MAALRAFVEGVAGLALALGAIVLTMLPVVALALFVNEPDAVWGILVLAGLAVWVVGGLGRSAWGWLTDRSS